MKKSAHETSMEQAFDNAGRQNYRREIEQRRQGDVEQDEIEAARAWLARACPEPSRGVEAGRIGGNQ